MADPFTIALALSKIVPDVVGWISGPKARDNAEKIVNVARQVAGADDADEALNTLRADPALQIQFKQRLAEIGVEILRIELADVQSARQRDVELRKAGDTNVRANWMIAFDALGLIAGLIGMVTLGWFHAQYPDSISEGVFGALIAQLATITSYFGLCLRDAHQFEFGSSRGSKNKDSEKADLQAALVGMATRSRKADD